jgi:hypothetical protein
MSGYNKETTRGRDKKTPIFESFWRIDLRGGNPPPYVLFLMTGKGIIINPWNMYAYVCLCICLRTFPAMESNDANISSPNFQKSLYDVPSKYNLWFCSFFVLSII